MIRQSRKSEDRPARQRELSPEEPSVASPAPARPARESDGARIRPEPARAHAAAVAERAAGAERAPRTDGGQAGDDEYDVGRLAAVVADEIRNPLTGIFGYAGLLRRRLEPNDEWLRGLEREAERIEDVIRTLVDVAELEDGDGGGTTEVNGLIRSRCRHLVETDGLGGSDMRLNLTATSLWVENDRGRLGHLLDLLLRSAARSVEGWPAGSVHVATGTSLEDGLRRTGTPGDASWPGTEPVSHVRVHIAGRGDGCGSGEPSATADTEDPTTSSDAEHSAGARGADAPAGTTPSPLGQRVAAWLARKMGARLDVQTPLGGGVRYVLLIPATGERPLMA